MEEIIKDAKHKKKTVHITFFDLADAFGSVPHDLIIHSLQRNHFPQELQEYFKNLYGITKSKVVAKNFQTNVFSFKKGVTQGDPMSPIIFILAFQPIIDFLLQQEKHGYFIKNKSNITLPYADDFCLITTNMKTHQRLIHEINNHIESMGMHLKPSKCRSFSIKSGKPSIVPFYIGNYEIPSIAHEEQKFLGKVIFFSCKASETFNYFKEIFENKLTNIDNALIRSEYKVWIYHKYFIPSIKFILTIHDLTHTDQQKLNAIANRFLKRWVGVPKSGTNLIFQMREGLDIPNISQIYQECHALNHASIRLKGDNNVNTCLNNAIERESKYIRKKSTIVQSENIYTKAVQLNCVDGQLPSFSDNSWSRQKQTLSNNLKASVKTLLQNENRECQIQHLSTLLKQGEFLNFSIAEQQDPIWKGFIYNLKKGTMKFLINSLIHTLPTQNNLKLWNKSVSDSCKLCGNRDSTLHTLSGCRVALEGGRYTWRHDNIVMYIYNCIDKSKFTVYSDIDGYTTDNGGTIPPELTVTTDKPDIVILDRKSLTVAICELTVPFESNIKARNIYKNNKYAYMLTDITSYSSKLTAFEIGARGFLTTENKENLRYIHTFCDKSIKLKTFTDNISAIAINSSYYIYTCRKEPTWSKPPFFGPPF